MNKKNKKNRMNKKLHKSPEVLAQKSTPIIEVQNKEQSKGDMRKSIDQLKDQTIDNIFKKGEEISNNLVDFKAQSFSDVAAYMTTAAEQYGVAFGSKGNVTLTNSEGTKKVLRNNHTFIDFDEKLQIAKELIDKCIHKWTDGANENIKALVDHAFAVDKAGKISIDKVLGLRRLNITEEDWLEAMRAISDSVQILGTKTYIRLYKRADQYGEWVQVALNLANV